MASGVGLGQVIPRAGMVGDAQVMMNIVVRYLKNKLIDYWVFAHYSI